MCSRIAILGGRLNILQRAHAAGVGVVLIHDHGAPDKLAFELCEKVIEVDLKDFDQVKATVLSEHRKEPFTRVISIAEECLVTAARLNEFLALGGNTATSARLLKDKHLMRRRLEHAALSPVRTRLVSTPQQVETFLTGVGAPIMLKPVTGAGSLNVIKVESVSDITQVWPRIGNAGPILAEELLVGPEISVESFSRRGEHAVISMTSKTLTENLVEVGHSMPSALGEDQWDAVAELVTDFLRVIGLEEGPCHTEVMLTSDGPRIVESQNRIGGGGIADLLHRSCGYDFIRLAVTVPLGIDPCPAPPAHRTGAAVRFFQAAPGRIVEVRGLAEAMAVEGATIFDPPRVGNSVPELTWSLDRVNGYVIAEGADVHEAVARCEKVMSMVDIVTMPQS
ncbi:ATP-grasp domain-containing protein [Streptomyces sp. SID8376]|uniref:ATP-grasp domain-containing protein n=1 Tax=unclassified Streptomyces TaxID=2593676 RepID=UPI00036BE8EF|nr:ATP-grasp domain-containing protein [Streptomyces sp. SID8376]